MTLRERKAPSEQLRALPAPATRALLDELRGAAAQADREAMYRLRAGALCRRDRLAVAQHRAEARAFRAAARLVRAVLRGEL